MWIESQAVPYIHTCTELTLSTVLLVSVVCRVNVQILEYTQFLFNSFGK